MKPVPLSQRIKFQKAQTRIFYFNENKQIRMYISRDKNKPPNKIGTLGEKYILAINTFFWYLLFFLGCLFFIIPFTAKNQNYTVPLFFKGLIFILASQPAFYFANSRYYVAMIPVFSIAILIACSMGKPRWRPEEFNKSSTGVFLGELFCILFVIYNVLVWGLG